MPRKPMSTLKALARHEEQQQIARETGEALRRAAALELGLIVLEAGGNILGPEGLRRAVDAAVAAQRTEFPASRTASAKEPGRG